MKKLLLIALVLLTIFMTGCKNVKDDVSDAYSSIDAATSNGHGF